MVSSSMFSNFNEEDYNQAGDSGDDSDSEEPSETGKDDSQVEENPKLNANLPPASALDTIKEALRVAANNRQQNQKKKSPSFAKTAPGTPAFIAPFLLQGLTSSPTNHGTMFQLPQGCVYTNNSNGSSPEGGANGLGANGMFMNSAKTADEATAANPLLSFPFQFNLQQMLESAALGAQIANSSE